MFSGVQCHEQELAELEGEPMILVNVLEKKMLKERVREVRGEPKHYMQHVSELLQEQVRLASGPNDVMLWPKDVDGMEGS